MLLPSFIGPAYFDTLSPGLSASRLINFYLELNQADTKSPACLRGTPGTTLFSTLVGGRTCRGFHVVNGVLYAVIGTDLVSVTTAGVMSASLGTLATVTGPVIMKDNGVAAAGIGGNQIMIVDGVTGYVYNVKTGNFFTCGTQGSNITGSVSSGTFVNQEMVTQASTVATAIIVGGSVSSAGPMSVVNITGSPDSSNIWTGSTSGATFTPTAVPSSTTSGWPGTPTGLDYIDGYFVVSNGMSGYASDLYDGTTWNPLATSPISATPDAIQAVANSHEQLWFIKHYSSEVWYNAGIATSVGFPFSRISGAVIDYGTESPYSPAKGDNSLFWLATQKTGDEASLAGVVELSAYNPLIISPPWINYQISQWPSLSDAIGYCYNDSGHTFYVLTSPSGNQTFVYDASIVTVDPFLRWHERSSYPAIGPYLIGRHLGNCYAHFNRKHYVGDWASPNIYEMTSSVYTDNGSPLISERWTPNLFDKKELNNIFVHRLTIDAETGVGSPTSGVTPEITLSRSRDGGHTWGDEYPASLGKVGEYIKRIIWRGLGYSRSHCYKLRISDQCKRALFAAYVE